MAGAWSREWQGKVEDVRNGQIMKDCVSNVLEFKLFPKETNENQLQQAASKMVPNDFCLLLFTSLYSPLPQGISASLFDQQNMIVLIKRILI